MNRANLKRRVLTGMLGGSLLLLSALHELSYLSVFVVIIFLSSREYYKILSNNGFKPNYNLGVFLSVIIFVTSEFFFIIIFSSFMSFFNPLMSAPVPPIA